MSCLRCLIRPFTAIAGMAILFVSPADAETWTVVDRFPYVRAVSVDESGERVSLLIRLRDERTSQPEESLRIVSFSGRPDGRASEIIVDSTVTLESHVALHSDSSRRQFVIAHNAGGAAVLLILDETGKQLHRYHPQTWGEVTVGIAMRAGGYWYISNRGVFSLNDQGEVEAQFTVSDPEYIPSFLKLNGTECLAIVVANAESGSWDLRTLCIEDGMLELQGRASGVPTITSDISMKIIGLSKDASAAWVTGWNPEGFFGIAECGLSTSRNCTPASIEMRAAGKPFGSVHAPTRVLPGDNVVLVTVDDGISFLEVYGLDGGQKSRQELRRVEVPTDSNTHVGEIALVDIASTTTQFWALSWSTEFAVLDHGGLRRSKFTFKFYSDHFAVTGDGQIVRTSRK